MAFIKEESEDVKIEEVFSLKQDTEEQTKMVFIKEESEDMKIEETFRVKHEQTGWFSFSKLNSLIWSLKNVQLYRNEWYLWRGSYECDVGWFFW